MKEITKKGIATLTSAWFINKMGLMMPVIFMLIILMATDYLSGMAASKKEALEHPDDTSYGWSSKKGLLGIYKKTGYILTVFSAICIDYLIYRFADEIGIQYETGTYFGLLVCIWFILNEMISILENAGRMGVELPDFLTKTLAELKKGLNDDEK